MTEFINTYCKNDPAIAEVMSFHYFDKIKYDDFAKRIQKSFRPTWRNLLSCLLIENSRQARNDENLDFLALCESIKYDLYASNTLR